MDFQAAINMANKIASLERGKYHLTYGDLIDKLKAADETKTFDSRVKGIGSYRGYYTDIALFTEEHGLSADDAIYNGNYDDYREWEKVHTTSVDKLDNNAKNLVTLLESLLGKYFTGYKGGDYMITRDTPLWLESESGHSSGNAITAITDDLQLVTSSLEERE